MKKTYIKTLIIILILISFSVLADLFIKNNILLTNNKEVVTKIESLEDVSHPSSQRELNGFFIGQHEDILKNELGEPYKIINETYASKVNSYLIDLNDKAFIAFYINKTRGNIIEEIQITGNKNTHMDYLFLGLKLGDTKEKVLQILGSPSKIEKGTRNSDLYFYEGRNYSVQIDKENTLISIKIFGYTGFEQEVGTIDSFDSFKKVLNSNDMDLIYDLIMPDIEITKDGKIYRIQKRFRNDILDKNSEITNNLLYSNDNLNQVLSNYNGNISQEMRFTTNGPGGWVFKFPDSKILDEIFFIFEAGKWRVWEIVYR